MESPYFWKGGSPGNPKKHLEVFIVLFLRKDKGKAEGMPEQQVLILLYVHVYIARKINDTVPFGRSELDGGVLKIH